MKRSLKYTKQPNRIDFGFLAILLGMMLTSLISIFTSFNLMSQSLSGTSIMIQQLVWYAFSFFIMGMIMFFGNDTVMKYVKFVYFFLIGCLIYLLLSKYMEAFLGNGRHLPLADDINGAYSWFQFPFASFQPSEFMKIVLILICSDIIDQHNSNRSMVTYMSDIELFKKILIWAGPPLLLILLQPDTGVCLIIGITENNRQEIEFEQVQEGKEMVEFMDALPEGEPVVLKINGEWQSVVVRERHDMYLAAFTAMDQVAADMRTTLVAGLCAVAVISGLTIFMVRVFVRKYLFDHFRQIQTGIYDVLEGKRNLAEEDSEIPELNPLAEMIFRLEREYMEKAEGLTRMEGELSAAKNEADYDRLTGLYNRNGFEQRAENYLQSGRAEGALLLFDLDDFKKVNDREGHPAGDQVLISFARCLTDTFRKEDVIARLGGDEFVVLLPGRISKDILEEKFRVLFDRVHETFGGREEARRVSVSAGAVLADDTVREYEALYACADTALYIAKDLGKDRYYISDKKIRCMRRECIGCREDCPRSRILKGERK